MTPHHLQPSSNVNPSLHQGHRWPLWNHYHHYETIIFLAPEATTHSHHVAPLANASSDHENARTTIVAATMTFRSGTCSNFQCRASFTHHFLHLFHEPHSQKMHQSGTMINIHLHSCIAHQRHHRQRNNSHYSHNRSTRISINLGPTTASFRLDQICIFFIVITLMVVEALPTSEP